MVKKVIVAVFYILASTIIGQNIVLNILLRSVHTDLAATAADVKFEVKELRAVAEQELDATRKAAELTRTDNSSQEAYTQKRIKALSDYVQAQRQQEIKQTKAISDTLKVFGQQLQQFDTTVYRLDQQAISIEKDIATAEESAYKFGYIICLWAAEDRGTASTVQASCRETIKAFLEDDMYNEPAPGWVWPLTGGESG